MSNVKPIWQPYKFKKPLLFKVWLLKKFLVVNLLNNYITFK